ncbi:Solanesyl diphosphate synthase [Melia azedarach]|uniref:Solanesyl diphosphate synthase n=1 Tax=Melia azedarach TaxID=155640 RepID=A0ACC1WXB5_MELAZ|nr:Solanesyl diphosphate synthase [Melia azedarach]
MIHVASLIHDDVLDDADTRRGIGSLNFVMGNKAVSLMATAIKNLVTGETMQMNTSEQHCSMEYYMQKTYNKTASLVSNSCKAIAYVSNQKKEGLAYQLIDDILDFPGTSASLGKGSLTGIQHGIITAPILFAMEEFPQLLSVVDGFDNPANVDIVLEYLGKSHGIQGQGS